MALKGSKNPTQTQTIEEYLASDYPELWKQLEFANKELISLQEKAIEYASSAGNEVLYIVAKIDADADKNIMNYIYALSLFAFASKGWSLIEDALKIIDDVLQKNKSVEYYTIEDLQVLLEKVCKVPFDKLVDFNNCSLSYLEEADLSERLDFWVCAGYNCNAHWSLRDITGTLKTSGLTKDLVTSVCNAPIPTEVTIPTL